MKCTLGHLKHFLLSSHVSLNKIDKRRRLKKFLNYLEEGKEKEKGPELTLSNNPVHLEKCQYC